MIAHHQKSRKVAQTVRGLLGEAEPTDDGGGASLDAAFRALVAGLPPVLEFDPRCPLGPEIKEALLETITAINRQNEERAHELRWHQEQLPSLRNGHPRLPCPPFEPTLRGEYNPQVYLEDAFQWLQCPPALDAQGRQAPLRLCHNLRWGMHLGTIRRFLEHPKLGLLPAWRLLIGLGLDVRIQYEVALLRDKCRREGLTLDLRLLAALTRAAGIVGYGEDRLADEVLHEAGLYGRHLSQGLEPLWPFFAERPRWLELALGLREGERNLRESHPWEHRRLKAAERENSLRILATMPVLPAHFVAALWTVALGDNKAERLAARGTLERLPGTKARVATELQNTSGDARAQAADWLWRLGDPAAIPSLRAALKKETRELGKAALMHALEVLGAPVEEFLDLAGLESEAARGLAKGVPGDLGWFPFASLPMVRWTGDGKAVPADVLRWFVVNACKTKSPEPNTLLRRYCAAFEPAAREAFGLFVLSAWIAQDTRRQHTPEQALALADAQTRSNYAGWVQLVQKYSPGQPIQSEEQYRQDVYHNLLRVVTGSAIGQKGVLAVVGACGGTGAVEVVSAYLKEWYGMRAAQCRALLQMLAWIEHPSAVQFLLAVAGRFRTKSIQQEAAVQVAALAARRGWTLQELADRTAPAAGFDEDGVLELSYGPRAFTARLGEDFSIVLGNAEDKTINALPEPNRTDDEELARDARLRLSAARKELKSAVKAQTQRLYEMMCIGREWTFEDWNRYIHRHPVMGRLAQRAVWTAVEEGSAVKSFRPLADRTLTNHHDESVVLAPEAKVRLAHGTLLTAEEAVRWQEHLQDYNVQPLFVQLGQATYVLPGEMRAGEEIDGFNRHTLEAFKLRGLATKLGYTRGPTEDGGYFYEYRKSFVGSGVDAVVVFSGNRLPEENSVVCLRALRFERRPASGGSAASGGERVMLGEVPAVLLSECWNDLRRLAAQGPGFTAAFRGSDE